MTHNDEVILTLKEDIKKKKQGLNDFSFKPKTNLVLSLNGKKHNLNVINKFELLYLTSQLLYVTKTLDFLKIKDDLDIDGYPIEDWIDDLKSKYIVVKNKMELKKLADIETRLDKLISSDLKTNLELEDIKKVLGL